MKKKAMLYALSLGCFLLSFLFESGFKIFLESLSILFLLEENIEDIYRNTFHHKISVSAFIPFLFTLLFFFLKEERLFLFYLFCEKIGQEVHIRMLTLSRKTHQQFLKRKEKKVLQKTTLLEIFFFFLLLLFLPQKKKRLPLFILSSLLLLKNRNQNLFSFALEQISLEKLKEKKIVFHKDNLFEKIGFCDEIVVTKTGVLTEGTMEVTKIIPVYQTKEELVKYATLLESKNTHPIAKALAGIYQIKEEYTISFLEEMLGKGLRGVIDEEEIVFGNGMLFEELNIKYPRVEFLHPTSMMAVDGTYVGTFVFKDDLKSDLEFLFPLLKEEGMTKSVLLSSSSKEQVKKIGAHLSISESYANLTLEDKISFLKNEKRTHSILYVDDVYKAEELEKIADVTVSISPNKNCSLELLDGNLNHLLFLKKEAKRLDRGKKLFSHLAFFLHLISLLLLFLTFKSFLFVFSLELFFSISMFLYLKQHKNIL